MADTVTGIETKVKFLARDENYSLTDTEGLSNVNRVYRRLSAIIPWSELNRSDETASTTSGSESVTWPATKFIDVTLVEMQNPQDNNKYYDIAPVTTEVEFSQLRRNDNGFPEAYKRFNDGTQNVVLFAPAPDTGSLTVRITGQIEPDELTAGSSTTVFIGYTPDDILAYLVASDIMSKRNQPERAMELLQMASELLSTIAGREITPKEIKPDIANG